jgi:hypothetical protein
MDEKEKKKAEKGPAWWYEPRGSKVRDNGFLICRVLIPIRKADGILSSVADPDPDWTLIQLGQLIRIRLGIWVRIQGSQNLAPKKGKKLRIPCLKSPRPFFGV